MSAFNKQTLCTSMYIIFFHNFSYLIFLLFICTNYTHKTSLDNILFLSRFIKSLFVVVVVDIVLENLTFLSVFHRVIIQREMKCKVISVI